MIRDVVERDSCVRESIDNVIKIATRIVYYGEADVAEGSGKNEANDF